MVASSVRSDSLISSAAPWARVSPRYNASAASSGPTASAQRPCAARLLPSTFRPRRSSGPYAGASALPPPDETPNESPGAVWAMRPPPRAASRSPPAPRTSSFCHRPAAYGASGRRLGRLQAKYVGTTGGSPLRWTGHRGVADADQPAHWPLAFTALQWPRGATAHPAIAATLPCHTD